MYQKDKNNRITLRLNDEQFEFVRQSAELLDVSPSDFLRMVINASMSVTKKAEQVVVQGGGVGRENDKADSNN